MAEVRYIKTRIWRDVWFSSLSLKAQNLYLFLVTNEATRLSGFYEMPTKHIAMFTRISEKELPDVFADLKGKVCYHKGWVCIKNYAEHQNAANSPKVNKLIEREMAKVPAEIIEYSNSEFLILIHNSNSVGIDTLSIGYRKPPQSEKEVENKGVAYGEMKNVYLTDEEKNKLKSLYGRSVAKDYVEKLSLYLAGKNKKYKNHYAVIRQWLRRDGVPIDKTIPAPEPVVLSPEQEKRNAELRKQISGMMSSKKQK